MHPNFERLGRIFNNYSPKARGITKPEVNNCFGESKNVLWFKYYLLTSFRLPASLQPSTGYITWLILVTHLAFLNCFSIFTQVILILFISLSVISTKRRLIAIF